MLEKERWEVSGVGSIAFFLFYFCFFLVEF